MVFLGEVAVSVVAVAVVVVVVVAAAAAAAAPVVQPAADFVVAVGFVAFLAAVLEFVVASAVVALLVIFVADSFAASDMYAVAPVETASFAVPVEHLEEILHWTLHLRWIDLKFGSLYEKYLRMKSSPRR